MFCIIRILISFNVFSSKNTIAEVLPILDLKWHVLQSIAVATLKLCNVRAERKKNQNFIIICEKNYLIYTLSEKQSEGCSKGSSFFIA